MATGRPPRSDIDMKNLEFALRTRAAPKFGFQEGYSQELSELIAFTLVKDPDQRPSMDKVLEHPYLRNTEWSYPTSSLKFFVREFQNWAHQGGQRQSLFNPHGAAAAKVAEEIEKQPEWRFSTLASTEMMDRLSSDLDYQTSADFPNNTHLSSHHDQAADMSSILAQEDAFNSYDASEPTSPYLSNNEATPSGSPTLLGVAAEQTINDQLPGPATASGVTRTKVTRGEKQLGRLFDPRNSEYIYPSLTFSQSDLPLRNSTNESSASNSKGKMVDASEIGTSNSGNIALADPATLKAKRLRDKDRPPTMAWDFATGEQMAMRGDLVSESQGSEPQPQALDMYQQSPAAWTPSDVIDYGSPGEDVYDVTHTADSADYGSLGNGVYEDSYLRPPTSTYASATKTSLNHISNSQSSSIKNEGSEITNKARQTLDLDALMDNFGTPSDEVDEVPYYTPSTTSRALTPQYASSMTDDSDGVKKARQTLDLDALMGDLDPVIGSSATYAEPQPSDVTMQDSAPYKNIVAQGDPHNAHPIFGTWRPAPPSTEVMADDADDDVVYNELMRMLTDHGRVLEGVADHYAQALAHMDEEKKLGEEKSGSMDNA